MTRSKLRCLVAVLFGTLCTLTASAGALRPASDPKTALPAAAAPLVPPEKLREDFRILRNALEEGHPGIYRYAPKPELDRHFDEAEKALDRPMNVYEFYRIVAPVVTALKCGHTGVRVSPDLDKDKPRLPLVVRVLDGRPYVLRDLANGGIELASQEIRSVNGVSADKIVSVLLAATPGDGDVQTSRERRIGGANFAGGLIDLLGLESPYIVSVGGAKGEARTVRLEGVDAAKLQEPRPKDSATLTFLDDGKIADLRIHRFGGTANNKSLNGFIRESFAEIDKKKSAALILDLRDNGGGADELGKLLLSFLIDEPFQYYDDLVLNGLSFSFQKYTARKEPLPANMLERQPNGKYRLVKHPNWGTQQPSKPTFKGKVYILNQPRCAVATRNGRWTMKFDWKSFVNRLDSYPRHVHRTLPPAPSDCVERTEMEVGKFPEVIYEMLMCFNGAQLFNFGLPYIYLFGLSPAPSRFEWAPEWCIDLLTPKWRHAGAGRESDWAIAATNYGGLVLLEPDGFIKEWDKGENRWLLRHIRFDEWVDKIMHEGDLIMKELSESNRTTDNDRQ
jgi:hypothetical protein